MSFSIIQSKALDGNQLLQNLSNDEFVTNFKGVYPIDRIPQYPDYPSSFIVNTDPSGEPGTHWLSFYYDVNGNCTFFDSFGQHPKSYGLLNFICKTSKKWIYNDKRLQSFYSATCGYYAIFFILLKSREFNLDQICNLFSKDNFNMNDYLVSNITK